MDILCIFCIIGPIVSSAMQNSLFHRQTSYCLVGKFKRYSSTLDTRPSGPIAFSKFGWLAHAEKGDKAGGVDDYVGLAVLEPQVEQHP